MVEPVGTALVSVGEFGPFHAFAYQAHQLYLAGFSEQAVRACRERVLVTRCGGDRTTTQFLRYLEGVALQELGRHGEAVTAALGLLDDLEHEPDPMWRAKVLAVLAESSMQVGEVSRAMDALAEGDWLVARACPGRYNHLSASMAVALALRSVYLFEQAEELFAGIRLGGDPVIDLQVVQEQALLSVFWGAALCVIGHRQAAAPHLVMAAQRALRMGRVAALVGDREMTARAEIIESYALCRLGYVDLAAARARDASQRFRLRDELVETHLAHLVLAQAATEACEYDESRRHLTAAWEAAYRAGRDIWSAVATQAMADLDVAEHGRHPAIGLLKSLARQALGRVWAEREGRFTALQTRNQLRALTATADRMGEAALRDPLTGLGNRHLLARAVEKEAGEFSVIFVDVDHFKQVNDTYTHAVGDEVLRRVADLLRAHCRSEDVLVRYGGDEFLILVFGAGAPAAARGAAGRLLDAVRGAPWAHLAPDLAVTVSVGVGSPIPGRDAVAGADIALYAAKRAGRDRVVSL